MKVKKEKPDTRAIELCKNVAPELRAQAETLAAAVYSMQDKIENERETYKKLPLAQEVTLGSGETILRANPAIQEYRATVRDYAQALNNLKAILENSKAPATISSLDALRSKINLAK